MNPQSGYPAPGGAPVQPGNIPSMNGYAVQPGMNPQSGYPAPGGAPVQPGNIPSMNGYAVQPGMNPQGNMPVPPMNGYIPYGYAPYGMMQPGMFPTYPQPGAAPQQSDSAQP